jgi:hypothetical protein
VSERGGQREVQEGVPPSVPDLRPPAARKLPERDLLEQSAAEHQKAHAQRAVRRERLGPLPVKFDDLALYNAERARGLVHTPEYDAAMVLLQCEFNEWAGLGLR